MAATQSDQNPYATSTPPPYASRVDESSTAYGAPARTGRNGLGTAALVLGIVSIVTCWFWPLAVVLGVLAIVLGLVGRGRVSRGEASNGGMAIAGVVTGVIGIVASIVIVVAVLNSPAGKCIQNNAGNSNAAQQCVK